MTTQEVSARFRVTTKTIRQWARDGKLKSIRLGGVWPDAKLLRFNPDEVEAALRRWGRGDENDE
jgi:excisionase family DNA binding protein